MEEGKKEKKNIQMKLYWEKLHITIVEYFSFTFIIIIIF